MARVFPDWRYPTRVVHSLVDMFRARMFEICRAHEGAEEVTETAAIMRLSRSMRLTQQAVLRAETKHPKGPLGSLPWEPE